MLSTLRTGRLLSNVPTRALAAQPSMLWKMAHGAFDPETPMSTPLEGIPVPSDAIPAVRGSPVISTLANGVRVATQDDGGAVAAVGVYLAGGSRHETPYTAGSTHVLEHVAFKGSRQRSKYRMTRDLERTGAAFSSAASRETVAYSAECLPDAVPEVVSILTESATCPAVAVVDPASTENDIASAEIKAHIEAIKGELEDFNADPSGRVTEALHAAAFHGNTLGLPLVAESRKLDQVTPQSIAEYLDDNLSPSRIVLTGVNVEHMDMVALAEANLGSMPGTTAGAGAPAVYTGGAIRIASDGPGHVAIGFNGVSWVDDDLVPACVLHTLLGGGGSFSSGGPGKGMYTRLFSEILNKHGWVSSAVAFNHSYADSGVFGIHASCADSAHLNSLIEVVGTQVGKIAGPLASDELERAKNMTKSSLLMNLEARAVVCEDIGRQVLASGKYTTPEDFVAAIDAVDEEAIRRVAARMVESKPALVLHGEEYATHTYEAIESSIKSQAKITS